MHKLYCYVDETGQDTMGKMFIVAIVVTDGHQHELEQCLEGIETATGKKTKWMKTKDSTRQAYINAVLEKHLPATILARSYMPSKTGFDPLEVMATTQAITIYRDENNISEKDYKVTITIDGLSKTTAVRMGSEFRKFGVRTRRVMGKKDESSATIRLADAIAGLIREAAEGRTTYKILKAKLKRRKKLKEF